jgi:CDP-diacylglycerol--serine O-phosphatidyltransferase
MNPEPGNPPSATPPPLRRRGIFLLPNLITTGGLFCGFYSIVGSMHGQFAAAAIAIFVAAVMDGLDGRVARLTNTQSAFGAEYDSLSDMVCFGLAPALLMYEWSLIGMGDFGWAKPGWLAAFFFAACAALRLARFNTRIGKVDKRFFQGLASPAAAGVLAGAVWAGASLQLDGRELSSLSFVLTIAGGALMVSTLPYFSFKDMDLKYRVPFAAALIAVIALIVTAAHPPLMLFALALAYAGSGPAYWLWRRWRRPTAPGAGPATSA